MGRGCRLAGERHNTRPPTISRDPVDSCQSVCFQSLSVTDIKNMLSLLFLEMMEEEFLFLQPRDFRKLKFREASD